MTKPKILHVGLCVNPDDPNHGWKKAFIEQSSEYRELNCGHRDINTQVANVAAIFHPDLVFMQIQTPGVIHKSTIDYLHGMGCVIINWNGDVRDVTPDWMISIGRNCISAFSNMRDVHYTRAQGLKAEWLEIGYDPAIYKPGGRVIRTMPIVFFGNNSGNRFPMSRFRVDMCNFLRNKFRGNFGEYGYGPQAVGNFNSSQPEEAAGLRFAKIAINCSHYEIERYTSDRMYRILGTGTAICLAKHYPGCEDQFEHRKHLVFWKDLDQLQALVHYYLDPAHEEERIAIVEAGQAHALANFSYDAMVTNIIKIYQHAKA